VVVVVVECAGFAHSFSLYSHFLRYLWKMHFYSYVPHHINIPYIHMTISFCCFNIIIQLNEARYGVGLEYLQSPLGRHLAMQQEIELRRRQIEEENLLSEFEYQHQLRRLQQQQLQGQFMYGHPFPLSVMSDEYLLQQQQQLMLQDQMIAQQQMRAHMYQQRDQEELLSMLHLRGNNNNQEISPTDSPYYEEPLPGARQSASDIVELDESHSDISSASIPATSSPKATAKQKSHPIKDASPSKADPPPQRVSSLAIEKSSPENKSSSFVLESDGAQKSQESVKLPLNGIETPEMEKISYDTLIAATEPVGLTKSESDVAEESWSEEETEYAQDVTNPLISKKVEDNESSAGDTTKDDDGSLAKTTKEGTEDNDAGADVDKAVDIVLNFAHVNVTRDEIKMATKWSKQSQAFTATYQEISPEESPFISARMKFNIHSLPLEPETTGDSGSEGDVQVVEDSGFNYEAPENRNEACPLTAPQYVPLKPQTKFLPRVNEEGQDKWWPSNQAIRKERHKRGLPINEEDTDEEIDPTQPQPTVSFNKTGIRSSKRRMKSSVEPGVLEKLPHCKLYENYCDDEKKTFSPKFCCQTTETFPYKAMVCCSVCSTWRHVQCGGHYKPYSPDSTDPSNMLFIPICDICYLEKPFIMSNPDAEKRLDRQRVEHLRSCNATNAVMRQFAFSKHAGPYRWPLGNVFMTHLIGHTKSVHGRHEKSEKLWADMVERLGKTDIKARERLRVRTREFERIMLSVEDAEGVTDRHNMTLFLRNDVRKATPAGFENPRRNIFDPEDDLIGRTNPGVLFINGADSASSLKPKSTSLSGEVDAVMHGTNGLENGTNFTGRVPNNRNSGKKGDNEAGQICARQGCIQKPRFDSIFCSDSCGVSTVEADLLQTLEYASEMHPTSLR
jgi:hypothetical protein